MHRIARQKRKRRKPIVPRILKLLHITKKTVRVSVRYCCESTSVSDRLIILDIASRPRTTTYGELLAAGAIPCRLWELPVKLDLDRAETQFETNQRRFFAARCLGTQQRDRMIYFELMTSE